MPAWKKGQSGNPHGRPKGKRDIDVGKLRAVITAEAQSRIEGLLGKAYDVIDERLDEGSESAAIWVLDKLTGKNASMLPENLPIKLSTIDDVLLAAQCVTEMALQRKMSVDDATKALNMLGQYAQFRAFERIDELREIVERMQEISEEKTIGSAATMPSWGRLSENSAVANKKPAE